MPINFKRVQITISQSLFIPATAAVLDGNRFFNQKKGRRIEIFGKVEGLREKLK
jgi:hypothetical protein